MAKRLTSSDTPWMNSRANPIMIRDFAGHCGRPPALPDCSLSLIEREKERNPGHNHDDRKRQQKKRMTDHLNAIAQPLRKEVVHDVDADVLIG